MSKVGGLHRQRSIGGKRGGAGRRRPGVAVAGAIATLATVACATPAVPRPERERAARATRADVESGLELYSSGDFILAAQRFQNAGDRAQRCGELTMERKARTAECTAWLRARRLDDLAACTLRLEDLHRREHRSDPGLNTLLAIGAVAGHRPLPPFKVPTAVHPIVRASAEE